MATAPKHSAARSHRRGAPGVSRRALVGGVGTLAAAATAAPLLSGRLPGLGGDAPAPAAVARYLTETRARTVTGAQAAGVQRTDFPINAVGVTWTGPRRGVRIRFYAEDGAAGPWQAVRAGCPCGRDAKDGKGGSKAGSTVASDSPEQARALVAADRAFGYELFAPAGVKIMSAMAIDTKEGPKRRISASRPAVRKLDDLEIVERAQWGADESKRFAGGAESSPPQFSPLQAVTVHHTDTPPDDPDPAATVRAVFEQHAVSNDWGDIGYHFLIDPRGRIYEGRWSGKDGTPAHDGGDKVVTGFHTVNFNPGNLGIAMLGTFDRQAPSRAARSALTGLLASLARRHGLDLSASVAYTNPAGVSSRKVPVVSGHRDWLATDCPGGALYEALPDIRREAARQVADASARPA